MYKNRLRLMVSALFVVTLFFTHFVSAETLSVNSPTILTTDLKTGTTDLTHDGQVSRLQNFLKEAGFFNTDANGIFGPITQKAVMEFQRAHNLPTTGYVGPMTRASIATEAHDNHLISPTSISTGCPKGAMFSSMTGSPCPGVSTPIIEPVTDINPPTVNQCALVFNTNLSMGSTGYDVFKLQLYLKQQGLFTMTQGGSYGTFNSDTQKALGVYQKANGIVELSTNSGPDSVYFGPNTRSFVNGQLCPTGNMPQSPTTVQSSATPLPVTMISTSNIGPSIFLIASSKGKTSTSNITISTGDTITIGGGAVNLKGPNYFKDFTAAWFFDSVFDSSCGNTEMNASTKWVLTCTPQHPGVSRTYVEIYQDGQTYRSNIITVTVLSSSNTETTPPPTSNQCALVFNTNLSFGDSGYDVFKLQVYMKTKGILVMPQGGLYGNFDELTRAAVRAFQDQNHITESDDKGVPTPGLFGQNTRAYVNHQLCPNSPPVPPVPPIIDHPPKITDTPIFPSVIAPGQEVSFTWKAMDSDNDDLSWSVDWGNSGGGGGGSPCGQHQYGWTHIETHSWTLPGTYRVVATVSDCAGKIDKNALTVVVGSSTQPIAPHISNVSASEGMVNNSITITGERFRSPTYTTRLRFYLDGVQHSTLLGVLSNNDTAFTFTLTPQFMANNAPGNYTVKIENAYGLSNELNFKINGTTVAPRPTALDSQGANIVEALNNLVNMAKVNSMTAEIKNSINLLLKNLKIFGGN